METQNTHITRNSFPWVNKYLVIKVPVTVGGKGLLFERDVGCMVQFK